MPDRTAYNNCMKPYMTGGGEDRKLRFCSGAKVCSGKSKTEAEARQICLAQPPKLPRERKTRGQRSPGLNCGQQMATLAGCAAKEINTTTLTTENFALTLAEALQKCNCTR